jgi:hypothetical protein
VKLLKSGEVSNTSINNKLFDEILVFMLEVKLIRAEEDKKLQNYISYLETEINTEKNGVEVANRLRNLIMKK